MKNQTIATAQGSNSPLLGCPQTELHGDFKSATAAFRDGVRIRRECLDHFIVFGESSVRRTLASYFAYYHGWRTHLSLAKDAPQARRIQPKSEGEVFEIREVGGLHHHYERRAA